MILFRRLWWATLPYEGWVADYGDADCIPAPWYAYPLAWLHRLVGRVFLHRRDVFGPRYNARARRPLVGSRVWKPWQ